MNEKKNMINWKFSNETKHNEWLFIINGHEQIYDRVSYCDFAAASALHCFGFIKLIAGFQHFILIDKYVSFPIHNKCLNIRKWQ